MSETQISIENETNIIHSNDNFYRIIQEHFPSNNQHNWYHIDPAEFDQYFPSNMNQYQNDDFNPMTNLPNNNEELLKLTDRKCPLQSTTVPLSSSVTVKNMIQPLNKSHPIELAYDLESEYKPRYKSDYFAQHGTIRSPRFVTDSSGQRFVTLQILDGLTGYIRVDWVTVTDKNGNHYSMPYKFQTNHKDINAIDQNPIYVLIPTDNNGHMQLELTLIKSKQNELLPAQPLQIFPPTGNSVQSNGMQQTNVLPAKDLIQQYQLARSQLAFTHCIICPNNTIACDWNTTVYSTVMTEQVFEGNKTRIACCPNCSHTFNIDTDDNKTPNKKQRL